MGINNYKINKDLTVDVDGYVNITEKDLTEIPVQFGVVKKWFDCSHNDKLTSLKGSPRECKEFSCSYNRLTSLEGSPKYCQYFSCSWNELTSLEGAPKFADIISDFSKEEVEAYKNGGKIEESRLSKFRK